MNIRGKWVGYYEYGYGYCLPYFGQRVNLILLLEGNEGDFRGHVEEESSEFSVPSKATVKGFCENEIISFIKTYPVFPQILEDGKIHLEQGQLQIEHTGYFDKKNGAIYGTWIIPGDGENAIEEGHFCAGIWLLRPSFNQ